MLKTLRTFYGFVLEKRLTFAVFFVFILLTNILFALNPYFYKQFVDTIPSGSYQDLFKILIIFMTIRILAMLFDLISFYIGDIILFESSYRARISIFDKTSELDYGFHTEKSTGSLISAFKRGDSAFFSFFHDIHHRLSGVLIGFCVMIYFLAQLNYLIVFLVIFSLIVTIVAAKFLVANNVNKRRIFNKAEDEISGIITDNLINFETVKFFAKEKWEHNRLVENFKPWLVALWGYGNSFRLIDGTMGILINLSIFLILFISIRQVSDLKMNVGEFVLVTGFISNFFPKLWDLVWSTRDLAKNYADIEKYFGLLDNDIEVPEPSNPVKIMHPRGEIKFDNVNHSYKGGTKNAIRNLSLKIDSGESVAFVGRSGSGKTTITKLLMRLFDPTTGDIYIDNINIKNVKKENLRKIFGVVPQEPVLFNNTIGFNIAYGYEGRTFTDLTYKGPTLLEIKKAAKLAHIDEFIEKLPNKYNTNVGERGIKLSGGQKQRLAIARMIISNPKIIVFDEATSHLDSESEKLIQDAFWKAAKGKTTIIVAHRLSTIRKADKIIVMDKGKIVEIGTHQDLLNKKTGIYKLLWNIQNLE